MFTQILNALKNDGDENVTSAKEFCAIHELSPENFHVEVEGVGQLTFPLDQRIIKKLQDISSEAKYGLREKTLLDKNVRHTQEILGQKLKIRCDERAFSTMLKKMRNSMGLSENAELTAHLHNMLIYGPGQFFKEHQDSEKLDGMLASLVIVLPSAHIGGNLIVNHKNKQYKFSTENIDSNTLQCLAFYADCHHEVEKIKQGYRLALTYNLVLKPAENQVQIHENKELEKALEEYFVLNKDASTQPQDLIYFLDHSYTEHSLRWHMLKGADCQNALEFRSAAKKLGLIPHLALVEHHESWAADGDERNPDPSELIDDDTTLSYWLDADDNKLPYGEYSISKDDVCWTKDMDDCEPFDTEFEGYMGNYGNTVDYWYRRAAVVLWPAFDQIVMDFQLNYVEAFKNLVKLIEHPGNENKVLDIVKKVGKHLYGRSNRPEMSDFKSFASIGLYVQDQGVARSILSEFSLNIFDGDEFKEFVRLQNLYGVTWCLELIEFWKSKISHWHSNSNTITIDFEKVVLNLLNVGVDKKILLWLLNNQIDCIIECNKRSLQANPVELKKYLVNRIHTLNNLMRSCDLLQDEKMTQKLINYIISNTVLYPEYDLGNMIIEAKVSINSNPLSSYALLRDHVVRGIRQELDKGVRNPNDLSIDAQLSCGCNLCNTASTFLNSKTVSTKTWPIVAHEREHVIQALNRLGVPVKLSVEKSGSPHKLVMVKSDKLYQASKERFDKLSEYYEKLMGEVRKIS